MEQPPTSDAQRNDDRIDVPNPADVLLGRGKPFQSHQGNQRMLRIVDEHRTRYLQADRSDKHNIIEDIIGSIRGSGGRFLRRVDYEYYWIQVSHSIAYRKVGHAFRSKVRLNRSEMSPKSTSRNPSARSPSGSQEGGLMVGGNRVPSVLPGRALLGRTNLLGDHGGVFLGINARQDQSLFNSALVNPAVPYPTATMMMQPPAIFGLRPELSSLGRLTPLPPLTPEQNPQLYPYRHLLGAPRGVIGGIAAAPGDIALESALARSRMMGSLSSHRGQVNEAIYYNTPSQKALLDIPMGLRSGRPVSS